MKKNLFDLIVFIFYLYEPRLSWVGLGLCPAAAVACIWILVVHTVCLFIHQPLLGNCSMSGAKLRSRNSKLSEIQSLVFGVSLCLSRERHSRQQWNIMWQVQLEKCVKRTIGGTSCFASVIPRGMIWLGFFFFFKYRKQGRKKYARNTWTRTWMIWSDETKS